MQVPQGDELDTSIGTSHVQKYLGRDSRVQDPGGIQENDARAGRK